MRPSSSVLFAFALAGGALLASCDDASEPPLPTTCAGHEELCDRRFDEVAFPATHNSMADTDHEIFAACQTHDVARQLEDGVRGFMIDVYYKPNLDEGHALTCHSVCSENNYRLEDVLSVMVAYLKDHRDVVLTIILENYVTADRIDDAVRAARAEKYLATHVKGAEWPTLREMIAANERLVILTDSAGGTETSEYPWLMDQWQYGYQNPYAAESEDDFSCEVDRGTDAPNSLFIMNHFLTAPVASLNHATAVNPYASLQPHVARCRTERSHIPNFVTVDFYEVGDLVWVVDELNGFVSGPPP